LWLAHRIDSQGVDFSSSDGLSNYTEEKLSYWIKKLKPKNLIQPNLRVTVLFENGRWYLIAQKHIKTETEIQGKVKCVAIDQGVRTFATTYSDSEVMIAGDKFASRTLLPLMRKVDRLISQKRKLENIGDNKKQWYQDRMRYLNKKISKLKGFG